MATSLRRRRKPSRSPEEVEQARNWKLEVCRGGCAMCREFPPSDAVRRSFGPDLARIEGHHIVAKQVLRNQGHADKLWDTRNGMGLCGYHHERHERWIHRVPRSLLPPAAMEFVLSIGLPWLLDVYR